METRLSKVLVIGAGGVGSVAVHKMAMNSDIFSHITLASRRIVSCEKVAESVLARTGVTIATTGEGKAVLDAEGLSRHFVVYDGASLTLVNLLLLGGGRWARLQRPH